MIELGLPNDRRWAVRHCVNLAANLSDPGGHHLAVLVMNISEEGCAIRTADRSDLGLEDILTVEIGGLAPLEGTVVWSDNYRHGLVFGTPLRVGMVQQLAMKSLANQLFGRLVSPNPLNVQFGTNAHRIAP